VVITTIDGLYANKVPNISDYQLSTKVIVSTSYWLFVCQFGETVMTVIYVRDYLNWIHDIQDKNALYSIDPIQTREWARRITKGLWTLC